MFSVDEPDGYFLPLPFKPLVQLFVAGERIRDYGSHEMPMGIVMAVVVPQHPTVVVAENQRVDLRKRVADNFLGGQFTNHTLF